MNPATNLCTMRPPGPAPLTIGPSSRYSACVSTNATGRQRWMNFRILIEYFPAVDSRHFAQMRCFRTGSLTGRKARSRARQRPHRHEAKIF